MIFLADAIGTSNLRSEMHFYENHRIQTIFVLLQAGVIMGGSMLAGGIMKAMGYEDGLGFRIPLVSHFVRDWGFILLVIPLGWTLLTIAMEQRTDWHTKRWTVGSGLVILMALGALFYEVIVRSTMVTWSMSE